MLDQHQQLFEESGFALRAHEGATERGPFKCVSADAVAAWSIFKRFALIPADVDGDYDLLLFQWDAASLDFRRQIAIFEDGEFNGLDHTFCNCFFGGSQQLRNVGSCSLWSHELGTQGFFGAVEGSEPFKACLENPAAAVTIGLEH